MPRVGKKHFSYEHHEANLKHGLSCVPAAKLASPLCFAWLPLFLHIFVAFSCKHHEASVNIVAVVDNAIVDKPVDNIGNYQDHFLTKLAKKWKTGKKRLAKPGWGRAKRAPRFVDEAVFLHFFQLFGKMSKKTVLVIFSNTYCCKN